MVRTFRSSQIGLIAKYIKNYYKGSLYIDQSGPFYFDAAKITYQNVNCIKNKKMVSAINKLIRSMNYKNSEILLD